MSLLNGRLVDRFGMRRLFVPALGAYLSLSGLLLVQAIITDGRPSFWSYFPLLALTFGCSMILNPNLNAMALIPVGDIAGTASSVVGAVLLATGTVVGSLIDQQLDGSITPFATAVFIAGLITLALVLRMLAVDGGRALEPPPD